jgi:PKD repeat protein
LQDKFKAMKKVHVLLWLTLFAHAAKAQQAAFSILGNEQRCRDSVYRFQNQSTGATSYSWDFGDGSPLSNAVNPTHVYTAAGNYVVTLQAFSGANVSVTRKGIHVKNVPNAYFYVNYYGEIYPGTELRFENNSNNAESQRWTLGDGKATPMLHPRHAYSAAGIYDVRLAVYNGCGDSAEYMQQIEVTDTGSLKPIASMGVGGLVHCPNTSVEFYNYAEHFDRLVWDFGDGTRSDADEERVYHRFRDTGSYRVKLYAYRGAKVDSMVTVLQISTRKLDMPTPSFWPFKMLGGSYVVGNCVNQPVGLRMYYGLGEGSNAYWRISDGRVLHATDTTVQFADTGNYRVWFVLENACGAKDSSANWIYIRSSNTFTATPVNMQMTPYTGYVCPGGVIRFAAPYDYDADVSWNREINGKMFYDTSLVVYRVPSKDTAFMVTLYRVPQCGAPSSSSRMVFASSRANPSADFMVESYAPWAGPMCYRDTLKLNANTGMNADNPVTHFWDFGDGGTSTAEAPVHVFSKPGWHTVLHAATNSCGITEASVRTFHTQSNVPPLPRFYAMPTEVCFGDSVMFDNFTMGADSMVLDYGDGTRDTYGGFSFPHIFHTYQNPGRYTAQLYVYNGCAGDTARTVVWVREPLGAAIRMSDTLIEPGSTLEFSFTPGRSRSHLWYRSAMAGDTSSALTFSKRYDQEGQFKVHLFTRGAFGCTEWDSVGIRVAVPSRVVLHEPDMFRAILYPNPTAGAAQLKLHLQQAGTVRVHLYDLNGRSMASLQEGHLSRGPHHFEVPTANLAPGMYLLRIQAGGKEQSLRILRQ